MKHLAPDDRPREKLERAGPRALGDNELLALVIGHGTPQANALDLANRLLRISGGAQALPRQTLDDLTRVDGVGAAMSARIVAAVELGRRTLLRGGHDRPRFASPREIAAFLAPQFSAFPVERFGALLLDGRGYFLRVRLLTVGSLTASIAEPREVYREAFIAGAAAVVIFHNHPSGDPAPSPEDQNLTHRFKLAGEIMGIELLDHIILADSRFWSWRQERDEKRREERRGACHE